MGVLIKDDSYTIYMKLTILEKFTYKTFIRLEDFFYSKGASKASEFSPGTELSQQVRGNSGFQAIMWAEPGCGQC